MQQMAKILKAATDGMTARATEAAEANAHCAVSPSSSGNTSSSSSTSNSSRDAQETAENFAEALVFADSVLQVYCKSCEVLSASTASISLEVALPAAPAAVHLILTTFQTCSRLQQLAGAESKPAPAALWATDAGHQEFCTETLAAAHAFLLRLAEAIKQHLTSDSLLSLPGGRQLLCCPELMQCLAAGVLVTLLGLDTGAQEATSSSNATTDSMGTASISIATVSSSSSSSRANRTGGRQGSAAQTSSQQRTSPTLRIPTGSVSSSERLANGISLDSLTPLSRNLFDLLGVDQGVLLQAARGAEGCLEGAGFTTDHLDRLLTVYNYLLANQVSQQQTVQLVT
jgi:hypothetical protein